MSAEIPGSVQEALASVRRPIEDSPTLPPACYTDPEVFQWEQRAVFQQGWVGVGRADRWPEVGDYSAIDLGGVPVVVVRDDAGALRAYANSCSHRAAQIMVGEGSCARMRCPFHFWTYGLDGRLIGAPSMAKTPDFERTDHGLHEFHAQVRHGFAFVSLEAEPPSIDEWMGDFGELHTPWSLAELKLAHRREFVVDCNWKPFVEVFNEYYHLPYVHPVSLDGNYDDPDDPDVTTGAYASHFGTTQGTGGLLEKDWDKVLPRIPGLSGHPATGVRYTWMFPNVTFACGTEAIWIYETYPVSVDRVLCAQSVAFPQSTIDSPGFEEKARLYYERFDAAIAEDVPVLEQQHAGLKSPFARQGRYSYLEPSVANFAVWYADRLLNRA
ncbi:MAG: aromatic ring-hydroxylating oxygenase subunit alpha [Acidimicrobiales bacterium]|jgi:phenylpropionate dioxygenase-like ring-hydroxylating dioxygenase large terminal subunit